MVVAGLESAVGAEAVQRLAHVLRDAGVEVVYAGDALVPDKVVAAVVQEDSPAVIVVVSGDEEVDAVQRLADLLRQECGDRVALAVNTLHHSPGLAGLRGRTVHLLLQPQDPPEAALAIVRTPARAEE